MLEATSLRVVELTVFENLSVFLKRKKFLIYTWYALLSTCEMMQVNCFNDSASPINGSLHLNRNPQQYLFNEEMCFLE